MQNRLRISARLLHSQKHQIASGLKRHIIGKVGRHIVVGRVTCILFINYNRHSLQCFPNLLF